MPKLTKKQINFAAKIYSLAVLALYDAGGAESANEIKVVDKAHTDAENKFFKMFPNEECIPVTLKQCIELALKMINHDRFRH